MTRVLPFVLTATVGSFARRLGMIFHNEAEGKAPKFFHKHTPGAMEELSKDDEELTSPEPLLAPQPFQNPDRLANHANLGPPPAIPPVQSEADLSPFMLVEQPQVEVELQTETDISLEEAEEAKESPFHSRLSMSLITCHEGATSSHIFAEVHCGADSSPDPGAKAELLVDDVDHSYALPAVSAGADVPEKPSLPSDPDAASAEGEPSVEVPSAQDSGRPANEQPSPRKVCSPEQPKLSTHIRCPTFDPRSPSQVVFKPQWLGKGFGASGLRVKSVHGPGGKGGSSPLAVRVAVKNATNENKGQSGKRKQRGVCVCFTGSLI